MGYLNCVNPPCHKVLLTFPNAAVENKNIMGERFNPLLEMNQNIAIINTLLKVLIKNLVIILNIITNLATFSFTFIICAGK